jgi:hypothetical protein
LEIEDDHERSVAGIADVRALENRTEEKDDLSGGKESSLWTVNRS